jgi:hypothetical protein
MNCIKENDPIKISSTNAPASIVSGWKGSIGIIIPNPIMSMKVVIKITKEAENPSLRHIFSFELMLSTIVDTFRKPQTLYLQLKKTKLFSVTTRQSSNSKILEKSKTKDN